MYVIIAQPFGLFKSLQMGLLAFEVAKVPTSMPMPQMAG